MMMMMKARESTWENVEMEDSCERVWKRWRMEGFIAFFKTCLKNLSSPSGIRDFGEKSFGGWGGILGMLTGRDPVGTGILGDRGYHISSRTLWLKCHFTKNKIKLISIDGGMYWKKKKGELFIRFIWILNNSFIFIIILETKAVRFQTMHIHISISM